MCVGRYSSIPTAPIRLARTSAIAESVGHGRILRVPFRYMFARFGMERISGLGPYRLWGCAALYSGVWPGRMGVAENGAIAGTLAKRKLLNKSCVNNYGAHT